MRQIVLDTETTGLEPAQGHRVIEIGCIELIGRRPSGRSFHRYLNPQRALDPGAVEVHGLTGAFLADKPLFAEIADELLAFIRGAELVIHNAAFDVGFLDAEFARLRPVPGRIGDFCTVLDTLRLARELHPGARASLDALCRRYGVDNSGRELHGALLDARILADVYLAMTGGQVAMSLDAAEAAAAVSVRADEPEAPVLIRADRPPLRVIRATAEDIEADARLQALFGHRYGSGQAG